MSRSATPDVLNPLIAHRGSLGLSPWQSFGAGLNIAADNASSQLPTPVNGVSFDVGVNMPSNCDISGRNHLPSSSSFPFAHGDSLDANFGIWPAS